MANRTRTFDWASTPLGPMESWSDTLHIAVNTILCSPLPMQLLWGPEFVVLYNDGLVPMLTDKHPHIFGQPSEDAWAEAWELVGPQMKSVRDTGEAFHYSRLLIPIHRDGAVQDVYWDYSYSPIANPRGEVEGVLDIVRDVTEVVLAEKGKREAEAALIQSEKLAAVGRLAASIAHEINNPLESVTNLLYLARHSDSLTEAQAYLDTAERELRRVSVISNQTLRFYRQSTDPRKVTCEDLFGSVLSIYQGRFVNSHIHVEQRQRASLPIQCFDGEIRQVLNNLVGNAIDAMHPHGGRLLLRSREGRNWSTGLPGIVLTVADTGAGIAPATLARMFEAFYTTKGIGGTGLGLWVSKEIVDRHQGSLRVRSARREDRRGGTVFTLFLPFDAVRRQS